MNKFYYVVLFLMLQSAGLWAQSIKGRVVDALTQEPLPGVNVLIQGTNQGTITNRDGNFELNVGNTGTYTIVFSFLGYTTITQEAVVGAAINADLNVSLEESVTSLSDLVVLGSRAVDPRSNIETTVPVDVISMQDMQNTGQVEPTQMINFVAPSFNSARQTVADGTDHIDPATLRGLGPDQVLVLLNGKRRHNQALINVNGTVGRGSVGTDLNTIPAIALERVEVLRDGAASQYGSDAIAGVINLNIRKDIGTNVTLHTGQHYQGDGQNVQIGAYHGLRIGKKGGVLSFAADLRFREPTNRVGTYSGPVYTNWNVARLTGESDAAYLTRRTNLFNTDEAQIAANGFKRDNNMLIGNSGVNNFGFLINSELPIGNKTKFYFTGIGNYREGRAAGFYRYPFQTTQVNADLYPNGFLPQIRSTIFDFSGLAGFKGEWGNGWFWDASHVSGMNSFRFDVANSNNASQFALSTAAPTKFYAGTLSFGQHNTDFSVSKNFGEQIGLPSFNIAAGLNFRVDQYQIQAGEEASWRNFDPASGRAGGAQVFPGFQPANAVNQSRNIFGAFLDLESDVTDKLLLNVAGRFENYSDFGSNFAGKFSFRYKFADAFSIRGGISNGFRAPSIHQRYFSAISTVFVSTPSGLEPRQQGTFRNDGAVAQAFGIPSLKAETSVNLSFGITSKISDFLTLTIDAYQIDIFDRIVLTGQFQRGTTGTGPLVAAILDGAGQTEVNAAVFFTNAVNTRTQGLDVVLTAEPKLNKGSLAITLAGNFNQTFVQGDPKVSATLPADQFGNVLFNRQEKGRLERAQPRNKISLNVNYQVGRFGLNVRGTRFGEIAALDPANPALDEFFDARLVSDISVSYKITKFLKATLGANNVLDTYPDKLRVIQAPRPDILTPTLDNSSFGRFVYSRAATQFGFNGGYYYLNLSASF
ncbi:MAG TPA: TonB-dependent receptor [Microscillaceae bacterium]|nr:TonB-dependent receptor [Microscillaceae bacterium]